MNIEEIMALNDFEKIFSKLCVDNIERDIETKRKQYTGTHVILDRLDKIIGSAPEELEDGTITKDTRRTVIQAKLVLPLQKKIVKMAVAFLFGEPVKLKMNNKEESFKDAFELLTSTLKRVKIDSFNRKLAKRVFVESKAAELWYIDPKDDGKGDLIDKTIKVTLLCSKNGDEIYPHFNDFGDMDAFVRIYTTRNINNSAVEHKDIYTAEKTIYTTKSQSGFSYEPVIRKNSFGKIPIIYYDQEVSEWSDVQTLVDRLELLVSKHADMNDYFQSPSVKAKGVISAAPDKNEIGKFFQIDGEVTPSGGISYGDVEYLVWENSPESLKLEVSNLLRFIYSLTETPDISFDNVKEIGSNLSGIAIKLMFLDSILKSMDKQEIFGEGLERRNNLLRAMLSVTEYTHKTNLDKLDVSNEFGSILPDDDIEKIKALAESRPGDNIISKKTAVKNHPFVENAEDEIDELDEEKVEKIGGSSEI